jgi:geranylgeranyl diphosphate synthase, type II
MSNIKKDNYDDNLYYEKLYEENYSRLKNTIEENLDKYLPSIDKKSSVLGEAIVYSLDAGGKRLRPVLLLAACEAAGGSIRDALPFACTIEFIHTYSLIHDDHPSMDNDDYRRGKLSNHKVFGDDIAILAGDGLLNSAMDIMLEHIINEKNTDMRDRKLKAAYEISKAAGVRGMISGQTADVVMTGSRHENIRYEMHDTDDKIEMLNYIHKYKTGAMISAAVRAGAIIGGAGEISLNALTKYAEKIGLVFQIVDDILDITGDEKVIGKNLKSDIILGKLTYPAVFGLEQSYEYAASETAAAVEALNCCDLNTDFLKKIALDLQNRIS